MWETDECEEQQQHPHRDSAEVVTEVPEETEVVAVVVEAEAVVERTTVRRSGSQ